MANSANVIALSEMSKSAGLITWWRLHGEVDLDTLTQAWKLAGLDEDLLPSQPSSAVSLRRALSRLYERADVQLQRVAGKTRGIQSGFAIVHVTMQDDDQNALQVPVYNTRFKVWLEEGVPQVHASRSWPDYRKTETEARAAVWKAFQEEQQKVDSHDLSAWLVRMVDGTGAVRLREGGGVYFVPETQVVMWRTITQAFESVSKSLVYEIPAMRSERAVAAILDAVTIEATHEIDRMNAELNDAALGQRAVETRQDLCKRVLAKVSSYESLLGRNLESLHKMISALEARLVEASLVSE